MRPHTLYKHLTRQFAAATYGLIAINVIIFLGSRVNPASVFAHYGLIPSNLSFLSMFTALFIHSDIIHLAGNMLFLWLFGRGVEFAMGGVEYVLFYIGSGFASAIVHIAIIAMFALKADIAVVGASGAIAGVLGVYAIRFHRKKFRIFNLEIPALLVLFVWLLVQAIMGFISLYVTTYHVRSVQVNFQSVGYWSHLGGFVFGMMVAQLTRMDVQGHKDHLMTRIRTCLERGMLFDALRINDELVRYDPADPEAQMELGRVWAHLNDREQSVASYQKAVELFMRIGAGNEAWECFQEMRHFWPGARVDAATMFRMSCYLEEAGDFAGAVVSFKRLASEAPESVEAQMALLKAGEMQIVRLKDSDRASETLETLIREHPHNDWKGFAEKLLGRVKQRTA